MGKTTLATAALHYRLAVTEISGPIFRFGGRASVTCADFVSILANHLGVEPGLRLQHRTVRHLMHIKDTGGTRQLGDAVGERRWKKFSPF